MRLRHPRQRRAQIAVASLASMAMPALPPASFIACTS